jgi:hypothetical protein
MAIVRGQTMSERDNWRKEVDRVNGMNAVIADGFLGCAYVMAVLVGIMCVAFWFAGVK